MEKIKWITVLVLWLVAGSLFGQTVPHDVEIKDFAPLDAQQERRALQTLLNLAEKLIVSAVDAMPAD